MEPKKEEAGPPLRPPYWPLAATVLNIQRMSTEDGPGIRTTVFFKGCPLRCRWCHNPESLDPRPQILFNGSRCIGCLTCVESCPSGAVSRTADGFSRDPSLCTGCGECAEGCPSAALERVGRSWSLIELVNEIGRDRAYFETSAGGVTASGGEPALQAPFVAAFLDECSAAGFHTALDTSGHAPEPAFIDLVRRTDLLLFDLKTLDPKRHRMLTGRTNHRILKNLDAAAGLIARTGRPKLWIRTPLIPDDTDNDENIVSIGRFISQKLSGLVRRWDLSAFNNLCADQYRRMGLSWPYPAAGPQPQEKLAHIDSVARESGIDPDLVHVSGLARASDPKGRSDPAQKSREEDVHAIKAH